ncbi:class I SAM-dependent methyltransferase [Sporanaerobium hydrogeniformans]|uniref:class I SAM-dependent methyltransferase n=1 Tax=Sporanaerobium hydrogeniformans TaxID=3072179 RepID=UPI0015D50A54|nr:methyltransferase domain-containing protein [Sporanaerobium hydrogeniformans]
MAYLFKYYAGLYDGFMKKFNLDKNDEILKSLGNVEGKKILDIGGGTGTLANLLQLKGAEVTLIDPSLQMVQKAREKNKHIRIYAKVLEELEDELQEEYFDYIIIRDALHHMRRVDEVIKLSHRYLKEKGKILIWEFNSRTLKAKTIYCFERLCFERCHFFTPESLQLLCTPYFREEELQLSYGAEMLYKGEKRGKDEVNRTY